MTNQYNNVFFKENRAVQGVRRKLYKRTAPTQQRRNAKVICRKITSCSGRMPYSHQPSDECPLSS